jgi:hypothetical protein
MKTTRHNDDLLDDLHPEHDFDYSKAIRGEYWSLLLAKGSNVIVLDPDVA